MEKLESIVHIIDDNLVNLSSLTWIVNSIGLNVKVHLQGQDFIYEYNPQQVSCLLFNMDMKNINGLDFQKLIIEKGKPIIPIIFISEYDDITSAIQAIKNGALNYMIKPIDELILIDNINEAIKISSDNCMKFCDMNMTKEKFANLSIREEQVLSGIIDGQSSKIISLQLQISLKTVEYHRASLMKKLQVKSVSNLIKLYFSVKKDIN